MRALVKQSIALADKASQKGLSTPITNPGSSVKSSISWLTPECVLQRLTSLNSVETRLYVGGDINQGRFPQTPSYEDWLQLRPESKAKDIITCSSLLPFLCCKSGSIPLPGFITEDEKNLSIQSTFTDAVIPSEPVDWPKGPYRFETHAFYGDQSTNHPGDTLHLLTLNVLQGNEDQSDSSIAPPHHKDTLRFDLRKKKGKLVGKHSFPSQAYDLYPDISVSCEVGKGAKGRAVFSVSWQGENKMQFQVPRHVPGLTQNTLGLAQDRFDRLEEILERTDRPSLGSDKRKLLP
jgi:hypothetical protein